MVTITKESEKKLELESKTKIYIVEVVKEGLFEKLTFKLRHEAMTLTPG